MDRKKIERAVKMILEAIGENPLREGLKRTPQRVAEMYEEVLAGYSKTPVKELKVRYEKENYEEIVLVRDIPLYSMCEHHILPFFGKAHVAYIPHKDRVAGLSKIVRVVEILACRLQVQERLTKQIADTIMEALTPQGVLVVIEAEHFCITMRGIKKPGSLVMTSVMRGIFLKDARTRNEAMALISK
ncbi:MAG: GTP cyclohydrolase I FolE [Firmicutes bacterium]|nr:GTP cyclohydrolase I FolE [Bacillota bacterium]